MFEVFLSCLVILSKGRLPVEELQYLQQTHTFPQYGPYSDRLKHNTSTCSVGMLSLRILFLNFKYTQYLTHMVLKVTGK